MTLLTPEYFATKTYTAQRDRSMLAALEGIQPGVVAAGDFKVSQRALGANMSVDVAAGDAWVAGTDTTRQGMYHAANDAVVNVATTTTGAAWPVGDATNPRLDQIILRVFDTTDGSSVNGNNTADNVQLLVLQGTATAGATLDTRTGVAVLPSSCIRIADVLVPAAATTVTTANIRDRRPWARGAYSRIVRNSNAAAGNDYTTTSVSLVEIDTTNLKPRIECSGAPLRLSFRTRAFTSVASQAKFGFFVDGAAFDAWTDAQYAPKAQGSDELPVNAMWDLIPSAGSHLLSPTWAISTGTLTAYARVGLQVELIVEELVRQNANNT